MKHILALLFVICVAQGQEKPYALYRDTDGRVREYLKSLAIVADSGGAPRPQVPEYFDVIIVQRWREYRAWCYADSTLTKGYWVMGKYGIFTDWVRGVPDPMLPWPRESRWLHREPSFTGFMEWLDRWGK